MLRESALMWLRWKERCKATPLRPFAASGAMLVVALAAVALDRADVTALLTIAVLCGWHATRER